MNYKLFEPKQISFHPIFLPTFGLLSYLQSTRGGKNSFLFLQFQPGYTPKMKSKKVEISTKKKKTELLSSRLVLQGILQEENDPLWLQEISSKRKHYYHQVNLSGQCLRKAAIKIPVGPKIPLKLSVLSTIKYIHSDIA